MMTFGSLFAGIGGFDLGLERAGMECRWQVEIDPFCQSILEKHWPEVSRYGDIKKLNPSDLEEVDVICGGFPCPAISYAAHGNNTGEWLWPEFNRLVREIRPSFVLVENVSALRKRGLHEILEDLTETGYNAEWKTISASYFGAPHKRARVWVVAYSNSDSKSDRDFNAEAPILQSFDNFTRWFWANPPRDLSLDDGISNRMALKAYGNAVVPQIVEWIGERLFLLGGDRD